jgi:hypothetical protein
MATPGIGTIATVPSAAVLGTCPPGSCHNVLQIETRSGFFLRPSLTMLSSMPSPIVTAWQAVLDSPIRCSMSWYSVSAGNAAAGSAGPGPGGPPPHRPLPRQLNCQGQVVRHHLPQLRHRLPQLRRHHQDDQQGQVPRPHLRRSRVGRSFTTSSPFCTSSAAPTGPTTSATACIPSNQAFS